LNDEQETEMSLLVLLSEMKHITVSGGWPVLLST
jgi:hypothetical protein